MRFGLGEHLTTIGRHWGKIVLVICASTILVGAVAFLSSKVYVSQARVLILNSSPAERALRLSASDARGGFTPPQDQVLTHVAILKSPELAERLAIELGPQRVVDEMTWRWDWLRELPGKVKDDILNRLYEYPTVSRILATIGIRKPPVLTDSGPPVGAATDKIMKALHAEAIVKTDIFGAAFAAPSGEFAAEALNGIIDVYVERMVELRRPLDTATIAEQEAERIGRILVDAEEALRAFSKENEILSIERQKDLLLDRWSQLQDELSRAQASLSESESKLAVVEEKIASLPQQEAISVTTRPNPVIDRLRERLVELQAELQRYVVGSAAAVRLRREIASISAQLDREAQAVSGQRTVGSSTLYQELANRATLETAEREALEVRIRFLTRELEAADAELRRVVGHELEYRQLARAVDAREEAYRFALLKREETAIQTSIAQPSLAQVVPVERGAVPADPSSPQRMRLLVLGAIAGLLVGIGLAYVLEFSRRTVSTVKEAEIAIGLPVLAVTERFGFLLKRLKHTRFEMRRFAVWVMRQGTPGRGTRLLFAAAHRQTGQSMLVTELAKSLQKHGVDVLTLRLTLNDRKPPNVVFKPDATAPKTPRNDLAIVRAPAGAMNRSVCDLLDRRGQEAADDDSPRPALSERAADAPSGQDESAEKPASAIAEFPVEGVVLIDAPDLSRFPELVSLAELVDQVIPVVESDRTRISEVWDLIDAWPAAEGEPSGIVLTKRRKTRSSWAFGWMASTQRKMREQT